MSFIRRNGEETVLRKKLFDGAGEAEMHVILKAPEEMYGKGRVFNRVVLAPGAEIGWHIHHGDGETYLVLKGEGLYNDNGVQRKVEAGDVTFVDDGQGHAMQAISDEPLEMIALILYK